MIGSIRKSRVEKSDLLSSFLASTCALTIGVNLSWTPSDEYADADGGREPGQERRPYDVHAAVLYLVAINWAQCSGAVVDAVVGPFALMLFGACASLTAAVLAAIFPCHAANVYAVRALQGFGCASLAVAVPRYVATGGGPYQSTMLCLIEVFVLFGTLIWRASCVLLTRVQTDFVTIVAVSFNLMALTLFRACRRRPNTFGSVPYRSLTTCKPTLADTCSATEVVTSRNTLTTLDTVKVLFAEKSHRKSILISLVLFAFRDISGVHVFKRCIRRVFSESNLSFVSYDRFDLWVTALQLIFTIVTVFMVKSYGQRRLMLISSLGMLLSTASLGLLVWNADSIDAEAVNCVCLVAVMLLYVMFFAHGLSSIPWAVQFETIHQKVRNFATGLIMSAHFFFLMIAESSHIDEHYIYSEHSKAPYWLISVCFLQATFVDYFVLEM